MPDAKSMSIQSLDLILAFFYSYFSISFFFNFCEIIYLLCLTNLALSFSPVILKKSVGGKKLLFIFI